MESDSSSGIRFLGAMLKRYADRFFEWFCNPDFYPDIKGDLEELYHEKRKDVSKAQADRYYTWQVIHLLRISLIRPIRIIDWLIQFDMFKIHFKTAWRNMFRNRAYSFINILGLALGLAAGMLVFCYTYFESNYDWQHPDVERMYRVNQTAIWTPEAGVMASTAPPVARLLKEQFAEITDVTRVNTPGTQTVRYQQGSEELLVFNESNVLAADSNFFDFFHFPLQEGDPKTALVGVNKVVISDKMARKYFGEATALGKILQFGPDRIPVEVTGVTFPQANNIHFNFDFLWSMPTNPGVKNFDWSFIWTQVATYVKTVPHTDIPSLEDKFSELAETFVQPTFTRLGMDYKDFVGDKGGWNFYLQPVRDIHLHSTAIGNRLGEIGDGDIVDILNYLAMFIILIAILNFVNLATARSGGRTLEVGVKKTIGADQRTLVAQFMVESICISLVAMVLALGLIKILQWLIFFAAGIQIELSLLLQWRVIPWLIAAPIILGMLAGAYPAFYLSGVKPMQVLSGLGKTGKQKFSLRNVLVTAQFTIAIALMSGVVLIQQQLLFIQHRDLGFNPEHIIVIEQAEQLKEKIDAFREELLSLPGVQQTSIGMGLPARPLFEDIFEREGASVKLPVAQFKMDESYLPALSIELKAGRAFQEDNLEDLQSVVINETTETLFGWTAGASIGKRIITPDAPEGFQVIGIVKDFHFQSLRQEITPLAYFHVDADLWGDQRVVLVKHDNTNVNQLVTKIHNLWDQMAPETPFNQGYYDDEIAQLYEKERSLSGVITLFTGFSLFIAIIGLIGLLVYAGEQRKKEIGVRKVLGASIGQLFIMLNQQYFILLVIALFLAVPLSWSVMQHWLNSFAYSIDINWSIYFIAWLAVLLLSFLSVSYFSFKAATTNVSEVLKEDG